MNFDTFITVISLGSIAALMVLVIAIIIATLFENGCFCKHRYVRWVVVRQSDHAELWLVCRKCGERKRIDIYESENDI